ncbi:MAG: hypothetical protein H6642_19330 [Caldilineaceae bacterium]|nr:hypothetical protein [Caldilineaceae bacterium]
MSEQMQSFASLFPLGHTLATPGALEALEEAHMSPLVLLSRHSQGDWGDLCDADRQENERALKRGGRLFSAYNIGAKVRIWIITESDRSATTLLLPMEY